MILHTSEREHFDRLLYPLHMELDTEQPFISGERFLMQKDKLVLSAHSESDQRTVIKTARLPAGKDEIKGEREARELLTKLAFTKDTILLPKELYYGEIDGQLLLITEYISQEKGFTEHTLEEQFFMSLRALESQEAFHATTFEHLKTVEKVFPIMTANNYLREVDQTIALVNHYTLETSLVESLKKSKLFLQEHSQTIDNLANYLTHTDFTPNNFRIHTGKLYLLDCAPELRTMHFGNKYEGWARFLNYMVIHNPELDRLLSQYLKDKRGKEEYFSLRLMRIYKATFLIRYYAESLHKTVSDVQLHALTEERLAFWHRVLDHLLADTQIPNELINNYKDKRNQLRSKDEKNRLKAAGLT